LPKGLKTSLEEGATASEDADASRFGWSLCGDGKRHKDAER
jgi:hypothetical protein